MAVAVVAAAVVEGVVVVKEGSGAAYKSTLRISY